MHISWVLAYQADILKYETTEMTYQNYLVLPAEIFESAAYVLKQKMTKNFIKKFRWI